MILLVKKVPCMNAKKRSILEGFLIFWNKMSLYEEVTVHITEEC